MNSLKRTTILASRSPYLIRCAAMSGKGSDSGSAGAINQEGGVFGKLEVAREAEYFYKKQLEQLSKLKSKENVTAEELLKEQIKVHENAINSSKLSLEKLKK